MSRRIVLPDWVNALKDRMNYLESELEKMKSIHKEIKKIDRDVKCLRDLVEEKLKIESIAGAGFNVPNIAQQNLLAGAKRTIKPGEHKRKSIHDTTYSYESKITEIKKSPELV